VPSSLDRQAISSTVVQSRAFTHDLAYHSSVPRRSYETSTWHTCFHTAQTNPNVVKSVKSLVENADLKSRKVIKVDIIQYRIDTRAVFDPSSLTLFIK